MESNNKCFFLLNLALKGTEPLLCDMTSAQLILFYIIACSSWIWEMLWIQTSLLLHIIKNTGYLDQPWNILSD